MVEIDTGEDWLIDWNTEVLRPTLPHPPLSPLLLSTAISSALPKLSSCSPSSSPVFIDSKVKSPCLHSTASADLVDPVAQPPASDSLVTPRTVDRLASPCFLPPSTPSETLHHETTPGSPVPSARPWSVVTLAPRTYEPPAALRLSTPTAAVGSSFPPDSPRSMVALAPLQVSGTLMLPRAFVTTPPPRSPVPAAPLGPISSPSSSGDLLTAAQSTSVVPRRSSTTPTPWLLPPSTPPWAVIITVLWVGSIWPLLPLPPPWMLPPSIPPWSLCLLACLSLPALSLLLRTSPSPAPRLPPKPPPSLPLKFIILLRREDAPTQRGA